MLLFEFKFSWLLIETYSYMVVCGGPLVVKLKFFVHLLAKLKIPKRHFEINWPSELESIRNARRVWIMCCEGCCERLKGWFIKKFLCSQPWSVKSVLPELGGGGGLAGGQLAPQYLAINLFQLRRADYILLLLLAPPMYFTFRHHCNGTYLGLVLLAQLNLVIVNCLIVNKLAIVKIFQWPICHFTS